MKKIITLVIFLGAGILNAFAQKYEVPKVEQYKLNNGFTVILCEDHTLPQAFGAVVVRAGSKDDPTDATGLAHYLEHMMFKGTQNMGTIDWEKEKPHYEKVLELYDQLGKTTNKKQRDELQLQINQASLEQAKYIIPNEYPKLLAEIGGNGINAGTSFDYTTFHSIFPAVQIEKWLTFYSNSFQNPVFRSFQAELETVYEEYNMYKDRTNERVREEIMKNVFPTTPYGRPIIGFGEHLKNPSLNKLIDFYNTYYVPNNMALVLCGDFTINDVKPHIEKTFGKWEHKNLPTKSEDKEAPFKGRKEVTIKLAPYESVQLVFRTISMSDPDNTVLDICQTMLRNGQTGFLDQFLTDGVFTSASAYNNSLKNEGIMVLQASPNPQSFYKGTINPMFINSANEYKAYIRELERARIIGIEETEKKLIESLQRLADGTFTDQMLDGVKKQLINSYIVRLESNTSKATQLMQMFIYNADLSEFTNYVDKVNAITKNDVMRVAKKYFGKDYMAFIIKRGKSKPEKLEKPKVEPLEFPATGQSKFAQEFRNTKSPEPNVRFVDFQNDAQSLTLKNGDTFYYSKNPVNDIFSFTIRFDIGTGTMKELNYGYLMNYAGGGGFNAQTLKLQLNNLNCFYNVSVDESYVNITLTGPEKNFKQAANLISLLINKPTIYQNIVSSVMERERISRQYEKLESEFINDALVEYISYGDKSSYIDRMTLKAIGQIKSEEIIMAFKQACTYSATVFCSGSWTSAEQAKALFESSVQLADKPTKGNAPFLRPKADIAENTIYFVHVSDSKQSQIAVLGNQAPYQIAQDPIISAFNFYFSGGFNGLMLQEIREKRSMAYGASAGYIRAALPEKNSYFRGEMSTQDDKTNGAVGIFWNLLRNMPQHPERISSVKEYLTWTTVLQTPGFRSVGSYIDRTKRIGYTEDPAISNFKAFEALTFDDIIKFWTNNIKDNKIAFAIVGDKSRINLKELEKYGKVIEISPSKLFSQDEE